MATPNQSVTADKLISATVKYSNKDDANRVYDISANARIENGNVNNFENGIVNEAQNEQGNMMMYIASFNSNGMNHLHIDFNTVQDETEASAILTAIYAFMADVKANVTANPVTA